MQMWETLKSGHRSNLILTEYLQLSFCFALSVLELQPWELYWAQNWMRAMVALQYCHINLSRRGFFELQSGICLGILSFWRCFHVNFFSFFPLWTQQQSWGLTVVQLCVTRLVESSSVLLSPGYERSFFRRQILQLCLISATFLPQSFSSKVYMLSLSQ